MKKYLAVLLAVLFILSFAVAAFALDKPKSTEPEVLPVVGQSSIALGGELRARGWYLENDGAGNLPVSTGSQSWYDYRVRLNVSAKVTDNTTAFVQLETDTESTAGVTSRTSDWYYWGSLNQKPSANMTLRQAYIQHQGSGLLGVPLGVKVGHMLLGVGEKQFLDHTKYGDDAIMLYTDPVKELHLGVVTAKVAEGDPTKHGDDIDAYVLFADYNIDKDNLIGLNYTLIKSDDVAPQAVITNQAGLSFQDLGLHANGAVSGLAYAFEGDMQFGKIKRTDIDTKFGGYGILAKLGYKLDPVNLRASFAMGSGDNNPSDNKNKEFQTTLGRDVHYTFNYEYTVRTAVPTLAANGSQGQVIGVPGSPDGRATGIANTTYYNLGVDYNPVKDLTLMLDGFILRATKALTTAQSKSVGSEVDLGIAYKIDKNLVYSVNGGALFPGKFYTTGAAPFNLPQKKTVTQAMHALTLSF